MKRKSCWNLIIIPLSIKKNVQKVAEQNMNLQKTDFKVGKIWESIIV